MLDVSIVNETSPEANWNRQTGGQAGRQTGAQDYVLVDGPKPLDQ